MDKIIQHYNSLVQKFKEIESETGEQDIHDKRVILRRIFPILSALKIKSAKLKNGEKAFKLYGKLRDIQVQIKMFEQAGSNSETDEYLLFIKETEIRLREKIRRFTKKKKLKFPKIKKNIKVNYFKIYDKASAMLTTLTELANAEKITDPNDIHHIRIEFKKFRYVVEILSYMDLTTSEKSDKLKPFQDLLGEIQDYEVLMEGIEKFYAKRNEGIFPDLEVFEKRQNTLIDTFENDIESFLSVCQSAV